MNEEQKSSVTEGVENAPPPEEPKAAEPVEEAASVESTAPEAEENTEAFEESAADETAEPVAQTEAEQTAEDAEIEAPEIEESAEDAEIAESAEDAEIEAPVEEAAAAAFVSVKEETAPEAPAAPKAAKETDIPLPPPRRVFTPEEAKKKKITLLTLGGIALALLFCLLFVPYSKYTLVGGGGPAVKLTPGQVLFGDSTFIISNIFMFCVLGYFSIVLIQFGLGLRHFSNLEKLAKSVSRTTVLASVGTGLYYAGGIAYSMVCNQTSGDRASYVAGSPFPYFLSILLLLLVAIFGRDVFREKDPLPTVDKRTRFCRTEMLIYSTLTLVFAVLGSLGDILHVRFIRPAGVGDLVFNGWDSLMGRAAIPASFRVTAFIIFMIVVLSIALFVALMGAYLFRSRIFYRLALGTAGAGVTCTFLTGAFGKYYEISQNLNEEMLRAWISGYIPVGAGDLFECKVSSGAMIYFILAFAVLILAFIRRPYSRGITDEEAARMIVATVTAESYTAATAPGAIQEAAGITAPAAEQTPAPAPTPAPTPAPALEAEPEADAEPEEAPTAASEEGAAVIVGEQAGETDGEPKPFSFSTEDVNVTANIVTTPGVEAEAPKTETRPIPMADPCPAFSELDEKSVELGEQIAALAAGEEPITLPELVQFVVDYARESRLRLSYTPEDIATFLAGLGATRLTILQGMSGTGKTSLPKIFTEAIFGSCDIVEVESSWRDKNELLGYYNEFSRTYTPRKFTQALYRAALHPERLTFIVLDEMNLSRVEYYFSDFLSLMENEEDKREIKLLSVGLYRTEEGERIPYAGLTDGHTIHIPRNIWFIGTANRDESTFEISDKVYDRAHTMNFNKRAPKAIPNGTPLDRRFISADLLLALLEEARQTPAINIDSDPTIKAVEELLAPYNISFGNRIANQIESFVSVYSACFPKSKQAKQDALERILLSKVVCKLEFKSVENKQLLAAEFARRGLQKCAEFIRRLSED